MSNTLTTAELAEEFNTTPRTLRKFLRADARGRNAADSLPGKGGRYTIERRAVKGLKGRFAKWQADEAARRAEIAQKVADDAKARIEDEAPETDETPESVESDTEPTDAELDAIMDEALESDN
jgi:hypothetical protein